jgi:methylenetetrahydrofolate dehydrogenase (NADP+)/methenyltetrahydrofolate cyclohydrolase
LNILPPKASPVQPDNEADMTATIIDGSLIAKQRRGAVKKAVKQLIAANKPAPKLAVILVGDDPASATYVSAKAAACQEVGIVSEKIILPADSSKTAILAEIARLNADSSVSGILIQLPLPQALSAYKTQIINAVHPQKDVDGFHPINVGKMVLRQGGFTPCTPKGCLILLQEALGENGLSGKQAVVIGRSDIVGNPVAQLLQQQGCTVTVCHSKTGEENTIKAVQAAEILIAAAGQRQMVKAHWIKPGACVIDVGIHPKMSADGKPETNPKTGKQKLTGDVDFARAREVASHITPVPGGVGPMTIACLLENTLQAYALQQKDQQNGVAH